MKTCSYCGKENDDTVGKCQGCGLEISPAEAPSTPTFSRRGRFFLKVVGLLVCGGAVVIMPILLLIIPFLALFYLPIYLPFILSFFIKAPEWRGLRWTLRLGSMLALAISLSEGPNYPNLGDDVPGDIAASTHNFAWTWGSGICCTFVAVIIGMGLRLICLRNRKRNAPTATASAQISVD